jgi:ketosteroid isomerase-like protein
MSEQEAVTAVIQDYFDALYDGDVAKFRKVFHPSCRLFTVADDEVITFDYEPYMARVAGRPSSASRNDKRADEIVSLTVSSPTVAHARVKDCYLPKNFINELTLLKAAGEWRIVAKVWHAFD